MHSYWTNGSDSSARNTASDQSHFDADRAYNTACDHRHCNVNCSAHAVCDANCNTHRNTLAAHDGGCIQHGA